MKGRFEHGGYVGSLDLLDFSASLSPLGMPEGVARTLRESVDSFAAYPDPDCRELTAAIAAAKGLPVSQVLACAGATDAFTRICLALRPATGLVCDPCYSGYEQALEQAGARVVRHVLREADDFALTESLIGRLDGADIVFLANPNNPTGLLASPSLLARIAEAAAESSAVVVLDESFLGFTEASSMVHELEEYRNLILVGSFTKLFAMAGVRLGYLLCADINMVDACRAAGQPWAVSSPAQVAGIAALRERDYAEHAREYVVEQREWLRSELSALGLRVIPGQANYLLFESEVALQDPLCERGLLVRSCENFPGLGARWYRVAVRTADENRRLITAMKEVLA